MLNTKTVPQSNENIWLWLIKIITGLFIIVILVIHFIVNHTIGSANGLMTYQEVVQYYQNPIIPFMEICFLVFVVSHSLIGLRSIILDMHPSRSFISALNWILTVVGIGSIVYGFWLIQVIVSKGS